MTIAQAEQALAARRWADALAALAGVPDDVAAHRARAVALLQLRRLPDAEAALAAALALDPSHAPTHATLAGLRLLQGRLADAAAAADRAVLIDPRQGDARVVRAQTRLASGDVAGALADADAAVAAASAVPSALATARAVRGRVLRRAERLEEALGELRTAAAIEPDHGPWRALLADALAEAMDFEAAEPQWRAAIAAAPATGRLHAQLSGTLAELGRLDEAAAEARRALVLAPDDPLAATALAGVLLAKGEGGEEALSLLRGVRVRQPRSAKPVALEAVALAALGRRDEAASLLALDRLPALVEPPVPAGFAGRTAFHGALVAGIEADRTLAWEPAATTTRRGYQTRNLLRHDTPPFLALRSLILAAVEGWVAGRADHPWLARFPRNVSVYAWATVLESGGAQLPHIHPSAIVSGVYYVQVPGAVDAGGTAGWIELGRPPAVFAVAGEPPTRVVRPVEGTMLLFPSWLYHRTFPFESAQRRISIAFDVMAG